MASTGVIDPPVGLFLWRDLLRSENRERSRYVCIPTRITYPPFSVSMKVTHE
jgi:hypothetical protein